MYERMGDQPGRAYSLHYLAWSAHLQGDHARARSLYLEALGLLHGQGREVEDAQYLVGVGQVLAEGGDLEGFARLLGTAIQVVPEVYKLLLPVFRADAEKFAELARATLGQEVYDAALGAGRQMSLSDGIAYAVRVLSAASR